MTPTERATQAVLLFPGKTEVRAPFNVAVALVELPIIEALKDCAKLVRWHKYENRGGGLEDLDPHCDDKTDAERCLIDEALEEVAQRIEQGWQIPATPQRKQNDCNRTYQNHIQPTAGRD